MFDTAPSNHSGTCTQSTNARSTNAHRYKYKHICIYLYTYMYTYISICISIQMFIYGCIYKCIWICIYIYVCIHMCMCIYMCLYVHVCVYVYLYIYEYMTHIFADSYVRVYIYYAHAHKFHQTSTKNKFQDAIYPQIPACLCAYTHVCIHKYRRVYHKCVYSNVCIRMFVFTHEDSIKHTVYILVWGGYE